MPSARSSSPPGRAARLHQPRVETERVEDCLLGVLQPAPVAASRIIEMDMRLIYGETGALSQSWSIMIRLTLSRSKEDHDEANRHDLAGRPKALEEYKQIHLNPWPELITAIQEIGIHNYNIFAFGTRLFAYMEFDGDDLNAALAVLTQTDVKSAGTPR